MRAARTARSTRASSSTATPTTSSRTWRWSTSSASPDTYNHYPTGLGDGVLDAVPDVQALHVPGRRLRPAGHPLAGGHRRPGRGARPVPPLDRHRADDPRRAAASRCPTSSTASSSRRCPGVSMRYSFDDADAPTDKETQYYEMLGSRGIWHEGWKAVTEHGPIGRHEQLRRRTRWQLFHTDEDRAEAHDLAEEHPGQARGAGRPVVRRRRRRTTCCRSTTCRSSATRRTSRRSSRWSSTSRSRRAVSTPTTRARSEIPERSAANVHGVSYKVLAEVELTPQSRGCDLRPRLPLRRPRPVPQGRHS